MELLYLQRATAILKEIDRTQARAVQRAADLMAESIASGGLVHLFGAGHSSLPVAEAYPKCGNIVGLHPIVELGLSYFTNVVGSQGLSQFTFLERVEGYGQAILDSYVLEPRDSLLVFSQSGINGVVMDVAMTAQKRGLDVIAVTSVRHCSRSKPRHSSGKRLIDVADVVIDNCVPFGDVTIEMDGMTDPIGPASTLASVAIVNTLIVEVARELVRRGEPPIVNPTLNAPHSVVDAEERMRQALAEYRRRTQRTPTEQVERGAN